MDLENISKTIIRYCFYALFFLVPLVFTTENSELFELSKMWITWGLTVIVATAWITRMIAQRQFRVQRTPLDIPLMLFLASQIISTLFSLDMRISLWGYYSRFNGGLLSTISYIILYYALVSNLTIKSVRRILYASLLSGTLVVLWGLPAHFGVDPTCYIVRGSFDISCWTDQFVPTVRIFSTLGQPAWMAAYVSFLIPVILGFFIKAFFLKPESDEKTTTHSQHKVTTSLSPLAITFAVLTILFYIALLFANTRAGFLAFLLGNTFFWSILLFTSFKKTIAPFLICTILFSLCSFLFGIPIPQLQNLTIGRPLQQAVMIGIGSEKTQQTPTTNSTTLTTPQAPEKTQQNEQTETGVANITDSGNIRKNVWRGAMNAWQANPVFGTGVETFAFAYYKHKPVEQNATSEWDYLYNKAHNEYLNYLATTGIVGLGTYLLLIGWFWYAIAKWYIRDGLSLLRGEATESKLKPEYAYLTLGIMAGLLTIYFSNFFGFSVVIVNLYLFLAPGFVFILLKQLDSEKGFPSGTKQDDIRELTTPRYLSIGAIWIICLYLLYLLFRFWDADRAYALGFNLNRVGQYKDAYPNLLAAVKARGSEPVFQDELAYNSAVLAVAYAKENDQNNAQQFLEQATTLSDEVLRNHPNNIVFMKNRVRMLLELSTLNPQYHLIALQVIEQAYNKAPYDAKIVYNYGAILGQTGQVQKGIEILEEAKALKPDFRDVYFALGLFYRDLATKSGKTVLDQELQKKAEENLLFILEKLNPEDKPARDQLSSWGVK
ncbi:MAG: hypothetical protein RLZZ455_1094 [Candidatus Parcubacteria bacterium]|jgi:tetratricopeptide (TPR) repeat protein